MSHQPLPEIDRKFLGRHVSVEPGDDQYLATFRYVTPRRAAFAAFIFSALNILLSVCFLSDMIDLYFALNNRPLPMLADSYLFPFYKLYSLGTSLASYLLHWIAGIPLEQIAPGFLWFYLASFGSMLFWTVLLFRTIRDSAWEPLLLAPIIAQRATVTFYRDRIEIGGQSFSYKARPFFDLQDTQRTRDRKGRHRYYDLSREIRFVQGAATVTVAEIFGRDKASDIQRSLQYLLERKPR